MSNVSFLKEVVIAGVTATVVIPVLWLLGAALDPARQADSAGLDLVVLILAGAGLVMLLRSTWRESAVSGANRDRVIDDWDWREFGDSLHSGNC